MQKLEAIAMRPFRLLQIFKLHRLSLIHRDHHMLPCFEAMMALSLHISFSFVVLSILFLFCPCIVAYSSQKPISMLLLASFISVQTSHPYFYFKVFKSSCCLNEHMLVFTGCCHSLKVWFCFQMQMQCCFCLPFNLRYHDHRYI